MNTSSVTDDIWWQDEDYGRKGNTINAFTYWLQRNSFWLQLALVATVVSLIWIIMTVKVFPEEIRDVYSSLKVYFNGISSSWIKTICRKRNAKQKRSYCKARYLQQVEEPQVRFEVVDERRTHSRKRTIPKAIKTQSRDYQQQSGCKRRTRIKVIDDIYGEIVGFQDLAGPTFQRKENPLPARQQVDSVPRQNIVNQKSCKRRLGYGGMQPRRHIQGNNLKPLEKGKRTAERPRVKIESANRPVPSFTRTTMIVSRRIIISTPNYYQIKPDVIRMRAIAHLIRQERKAATKSITVPLIDATGEQNEDLVETMV